MEHTIESRLELNKNIPTALTPEERRTKLRAQMIRQRIMRGATDTVRLILDSMTDEQLVEKELAHHAVKIGAMAAQHADRKRKQ